MKWSPAPSLEQAGCKVYKAAEVSGWWVSTPTSLPAPPRRGENQYSRPNALHNNHSAHQDVFAAPPHRTPHSLPHPPHPPPPPSSEHSNLLSCLLVFARCKKVRTPRPHSPPPFSQLPPPLPTSSFLPFRGGYLGQVAQRCK